MKVLVPSAISGEGTRWKLSLIMLLSAFVASPLRAQVPPREPPQAAVQSTPQKLAPEALNELLAPIALYPDALIALILPASTVPSDLVLAARYIASNGDPAQVANQLWDDSVKSLVRYPDVLKWMDQNLEWTTAVGEAFLDQPADVMNSIQGLRAEALAAGNLTDTPQQQVVQEEAVIRIVPAQPDVIYVPQYDPEVVYVQPYTQDFAPLLTFGAGFAVGSWLNYDCDWGRRSVYVGQWRPGWKHDRKWDRGDRDRNWDRGDQGQNINVDVVNINSDTARQWQPSANSQRRQAQHQRRNRANTRLAGVNALDANNQPVGPSTPGLTRGADSRANRVPKPARADFTSQGNERIRRDSQDSNGSNTSPPVLNDATPGARGKNRKAPGPTVAPNVAGEQGTSAQDGGRDSAPRKSKHAQGGHQNVAPKASGVTNATPGGRGKNKVSEPTVAPNVPGGQGAPSHSNGQGSAPRNLKKHAQSDHHSSGGVNSQRTTAPSSTGTSTQKRQKRVDHSQSSSPQSNDSPHPSNAQKHQQKHASQSATSLPKQNNPPQPPPAAAQHDQRSKRSAAAVQQNTGPQSSNASHGKGKGKGGGEKKTDEKKNKGDN
jgi:Protein of unknown function (DUF3300)